MLTHKYIPGFLILILTASCWFTVNAQTDSTSVKLKNYKDFYEMGLIDSMEYATLKAKLLGTPIPVFQQPVVTDNPVNGKIIEDTTVYYQTGQSGKVLPAGAYMGMQEIRERRPSLQCIVKIIKRDTYDYSSGAGGNIELLPADKCISKIKLKLDVWVYSTGEKCYVNLDHFKMQPYYNTILTMGRFLAFYKNETQEAVQKANSYGGGAKSDMAQASDKTFKKLYVIDTETAMLNPVTPEYMQEVLKAYPAILTKYQAEAGQTAQVWARYLQMVNDAK